MGLLLGVLLGPGRTPERVQCTGVTLERCPQRALHMGLGLLGRTCEDGDQSILVFGGCLADFHEGVGEILPLGRRVVDALESLGERRFITFGCMCGAGGVSLAGKLACLAGFLVSQFYGFRGSFFWNWIPWSGSSVPQK